MGSDYAQIFRWFAKVADDEFVHPLSWIDKERLRHDPEYGLKCFLTYAQTRQGTPQGYVPAWIKSFSRCYRDHLPLSELGGLFGEFWSRSANRQRNPIFDDAHLPPLHIPSVMSHPSLQFKQVSAQRSVHSARIGLGYRALGNVESDTLVWFWIGSHADYDRLVSRT